MEESELEEGEACSYNITNDYGGSIDPDNDLSYIDEKLQNILGHFQKDFEGNFSAENLGAKFGGYGSFLPTYQRSPVWSHPKTPAKPLSSTGTTRSPINVLGEFQSGNAASSSVPKRAKSGLASSGNLKKSMKTKKPNSNSSSKQESGTKKPGVFSKQNSLKLRIKMGSDSVSAEKNAAAIYNGLGLDMSPSLSLDNNSLSGSEGMLNGEPQGYSPLLSPASIVNVMTSLAVDHRQLLSPLSDDLIRFVEKVKPEKVYKHTSPFRFTDSSAAIMNGLEPKKEVEEKQLVEKKRKTVEKNSLSADTNFRGKNATIKEPVETHTLYPIAAEKEKLSDASKDNYNGAVKSEMVSDGERRSWGITRHKDLGPYHENPKTSSAGSVREDKKRDDDDASGYSRKVGKCKRNKASDLVKKESKVKSVPKAEPEQHTSRKRKSDQIEQEPSKSKELKSSVVVETKMNGQAEKKEVVASKPQNDVKKPEDAYKDFFGELGDSEEEEEEDEVKDSRMMSEKRLPVLDNTPEKPSLKTETQNIGPGPTSLPKANPVIIQEHWVACDKCGKWRLLPFGVFPENLPEKWMCTMLNWLPDVNYCHVPEDETTKALYAMYQISPPDSQAPIQSNNPSGPKPQLNQGDDNTRRKKKGVKKIESGIDKEGSSRAIAETNKKTVQPSLKNGNINSSHDLVEEKQKQKEKGRASTDHHSDDSRSLKANKQRNADQESSMLANKMKIESFLFPEESEQGNVRPSSSSGLPDKKPKPRVSSILLKEEGGASDTGNSDSKGGNKKRKSHGSSRVYSENENHERKKARVVKDEKEPSGNVKPERSEKKNRSHSKREYGGVNVQNSIAATSSSSKISDSHKHRNTSLHEAKSSPVESVSSSPMRISNPEKNVSARKKKEEAYDANVFAADNSLRKKKEEPYDGEDDGGASDRSQTRIREKHGSHESYAKERGEPSLDANFEESCHKELPQKPEHVHGEEKQTSDHHRHRRSNESLAKKSGKSSSSRSKDKSIRSDSRDGPRHVEKKIYDASPDMAVRPNIPKPYDNSRADIASDRETSQPRPPSRGVQGDSSMLSARKKVEKCSTSAGNANNIQAESQVRRKNEPSPSPLRKEVTSVQVANNTIKEAKDLKHTADRLKNTVSNLEHIELYFQACLKFLHGAYLYEMSSNENPNRQGDTMIQSQKIYSTTANLCGFCAHEYEKSKDMGAAALAYKCMEVAHMRVVNMSYTSANRLRSELQTSLQMVPPGESPSSSASDVDNVNHPAATGADNKIGTTSRGINSPLVTGNHVISAQNRSNILRLLQFAQEVNLGMDASRKSRLAFAASIENLGEGQHEGEGIVSIRTALDYNFQDLEGFLRLVKLAMKANNR